MKNFSKSARDLITSIHKVDSDNYPEVYYDHGGLRMWARRVMNHLFFFCDASPDVLNFIIDTASTIHYKCQFRVQASAKHNKGISRCKNCIKNTSKPSRRV